MLMFVFGLVVGVLVCEALCQWNAGFSLLRETWCAIVRVVRH
ncbi:hypothetical protein [Allopusillimonas soli]|nr:hypothetical protein [Allopusillimonas soli]